MKATRERKQEKPARAACGSAQGKLERMNRKQRRELARKIQADDVSLEIVHPEDGSDAVHRGVLDTGI
jgi:hypothetical protein